MHKSQTIKFGFFYIAFKQKTTQIAWFFYYASPVGPKLIGTEGCS
ncbi:hypothetical protein AX016_1652 [Cellulophaga sp. RHA19]|nr:hypothetical protein AX016_1652 [Cellulophaga sp. RHA19]